MGLSIRTHAWRYTRWMAWDGDALAPVWDAVLGEELYGHAGDDGRDLDAFENENYAGAKFAQLVQEDLADRLRAGWRRRCRGRTPSSASGCGPPPRRRRRVAGLKHDRYDGGELRASSYRFIPALWPPPAARTVTVTLATARGAAPRPAVAGHSSSTCGSWGLIAHRSTPSGSITSTPSGYRAGCDGCTGTVLTKTVAAGTSAAGPSAAGPPTRDATDPWSERPWSERPRGACSTGACSTGACSTQSNSIDIAPDVSLNENRRSAPCTARG